MEMMILQYNWLYPPLGTGRAVMCKILAEKLVEKGYSVHVYTHRYVSGLPRDESINGVMVHRRGPLIPSTRVVDYPLKLLQEIVNLGWFKKNLWQYDLLHVHGPTYGFKAPFRGKQFKGWVEALKSIGDRYPVVYTYHSRADEATLSDILDNIDVITAVVALSKSIRNEVLRIAGKHGLDGRMLSSKIFVIPNGVDERFFDDASLARAYPGLYGVVKAIRSKCFIIGFVGSITRLKGVWVLLEAFRKVSQLYPGRCIKLVLVGSHPSRLDEILFRRKVEDLGLGRGVVMLGGVDYNLMPYIYRVFSVFVLPSLYEGMPMSLLEAMASMLPVVSTPVGGIPEVILDGYNGLLVKPGDHGELSDALISLIENEDLRMKLAFNAYHVARNNYSPRVMAEKYVEIYKLSMSKAG